MRPAVCAHVQPGEVTHVARSERLDELDADRRVALEDGHPDLDGDADVQPVHGVLLVTLN